MCWTLFKTIGHSLKNLGPLRKLFSPPAVRSWLRAWFLGITMNVAIHCDFQQCVVFPVKHLFEKNEPFSEQQVFRFVKLVRT